MKPFFLPFILLMGLHLSINAQYATDFTCNDCSGNSFHLFDEVGDNHVMVICWVMPCSACIGPAKTAYSVYKAFQESNPGVVKMILADDYADSYCSSLQSWATTNRLDNIPVFVNSAIDMQDYGADGMPKIVVIAGSDKKVYFEANNFINGDSMFNAIQTAIAALGLGISNHTGDEITIIRMDDKLEIRGNLSIKGQVDIRIHDLQGRLMDRREISGIGKGEAIRISTLNLPAGAYLVQIQSDVANYSRKIIID